MSTALKTFSIIFLVFVLLLINGLVIKEKISVKYSIVWSIPCVLLLLFVLIPGLLQWVSNLFGFQTASNMIFAGLIALLLVINLALTVIVSTQKREIRCLIQEVSLAKERKNGK